MWSGNHTGDGIADWCCCIHRPRPRHPRRKRRCGMMLAAWDGISLMVLWWLAGAMLISVPFGIAVVRATKRHAAWMLLLCPAIVGAGIISTVHDRLMRLASDKAEYRLVEH